MANFGQGLVIGKFYPLHLGHVSLIEHASARCDRLAVIVLASQLESIPLADRVEWTRESTAHLGNVTVLGIIDDAPVDYNSDLAWVAHVELMRAALRFAGAGEVDAVFGSEPYVAELASRFTAIAIMDDVDRVIVPMSGTAARADLVGRWMMLPPATRRGLATRVIVVGAESTGTTTLANALVELYRRRFTTIMPVEEYGRTFTYELAAVSGAGINDLVWTTEHFAHIAASQTDLENVAADASPLVIADSDAFATSVWERRYVGETSHGAADAAGPLLPRRALYFVTDDVGVPFEQDGWRDGEHLRADMTRWFIDGLTERGLPWVLLRGSHEERMAYAVKAIDPLLAARMTLGHER
jgi:NadR type nicotinamide-nucleotide adenylyltransferase